MRSELGREARIISVLIDERPRLLPVRFVRLVATTPDWRSGNRELRVLGAGQDDDRRQSNTPRRGNIWTGGGIAHPCVCITVIVAIAKHDGFVCWCSRSRSLPVWTISGSVCSAARCRCRRATPLIGSTPAWSCRCLGDKAISARACQVHCRDAHTRMPATTTTMIDGGQRAGGGGEAGNLGRDPDNDRHRPVGDADSR